MSDNLGCACGTGGKEITKVTTGNMSKPATGRKTGKAPKGEGKEPQGDFKK